MNRRDFTRGLTSLGLAPALPAQALGSGASGAAVAATATAERMYFVSWYTARLNKTCSAETLVSELNMNPDIAREVFGRLVQSNTVSAPNVLGVSRTIDPLSNGYAQISGHAVKRMAAKHTTPDQTDGLTKLKQLVTEDDHAADLPVEDLADAAEISPAAEPSQAAESDLAFTEPGIGDCSNETDPPA